MLTLCDDGKIRPRRQALEGEGLRIGQAMVYSARDGKRWAEEAIAEMERQDFQLTCTATVQQAMEMAEKLFPRMFAALPQKHSGKEALPTGERYAYGSKQAMATPAGQILKALADRVRNRLKKVNSAKASQHRPDFTASEETSISEANAAAASLIDGSEQTEETPTCETQTVTQAAEFSAVELLHMLAQCPEMESHKAIISKWLKELSQQ